MTYGRDDKKRMEIGKSNTTASTRTDVSLLECFGLAPNKRVKYALGPPGQLMIQIQEKEMSRPVSIPWDGAVRASLGRARPSES